MYIITYMNTCDMKYKIFLNCFIFQCIQYAAVVGPLSIIYIVHFLLFVHFFQTTEFETPKDQS